MSNFRRDTLLGTRYLAITLDVQRWRFRLETLFEAIMFAAAIGVIVIAWHTFGE